MSTPQYTEADIMAFLQAPINGTTIGYILQTGINALNANAANAARKKGDTSKVCIYIFSLLQYILLTWFNPV